MILQEYKISIRESFILLSKIRLKSFLLCYSYMIVLMVVLLVTMINSHYKYIYILKQDQLTLFLGKYRILDLIEKIIVILVTQHIISLSKLENIIQIHIISRDLISCHMQLYLFRKYIYIVILLSQLYKSVFHSGYLTCNIYNSINAIIRVFYLS